MRLPRLFLAIPAAIIGAATVGIFLVSAETSTSTPLNVASPSTVLATSTLEALKSKNDDEIQVLNQEIAARKDKIKQLESTIADYNKSIVQKQTEAATLKNAITILNTRIDEAKSELDLTKEKLKTTELEIAALQVQIDDKNTTINRQKKVIATMVESIHASDQKNYVEIMLTYKNFSEFYNEAKNAESVYVDLGRSVRTLKLAKDELVGKQTEQNQKKQAYLALKSELEEKSNQLAAQQNAKTNLLTETRSSEQRYQTLLSSLKQQYQVIENEQKTFEDQLRRKLEAENKIKPNGNLVFTWPVPSRIINAYYHDADYPFIKVFQHSGLDMKAAYGTPVKAAGSGYVAVAKRCSTASCYSYVLLVHNGTLSTVYGHLSQVNVSVNQFVNQGDVIGISGGTPGTIGAGPFVTGAHLHFEVRASGIPVDPLPYLQ